MRGLHGNRKSISKGLLTVKELHIVFASLSSWTDPDLRRELWVVMAKFWDVMSGESHPPMIERCNVSVRWLNDQITNSDIFSDHNDDGSTKRRFSFLSHANDSVKTELWHLKISHGRC